MKKIKNNYLTVIFVLIISVLHGQQFTAKVNYKVKVVKEFSLTKGGKENKETIKKTMSSLENYVKNNIDGMDYLLFLNKREAIYELSPILEGTNNLGLKLTTGFTGLATFYFNTVTKIIIKQTQAYGQLFLIESKLNKRKWVLTQDTKTIGGYLCYKATSIKVIKNSKGVFKRPVTAWYAPKLSVPYGPKGYGGLPGLIMQLTEGDFTFYVSKLTLNPKNGVKIKRPIKGKKVTQEEFFAIGLQSTSNFGKFNH